MSKKQKIILNNNEKNSQVVYRTGEKKRERKKRFLIILFALLFVAGSFSAFALFFNTSIPAVASQLNAPTNVKVVEEQNEDGKSYMLSFDEVRNANGYAVYIFKGKEELQKAISSGYKNLEPTISFNANSWEISDYLNGAGFYYVSVQALYFKVPSYNSDLSNPKECCVEVFYDLKMPVITVDNDNYAVSWTASGTTGIGTIYYELQVISSDTNETLIEATSYSNSYDFTEEQKQILNNEKGINFEIKVRALSTDSIAIPSEWGEASMHTYKQMEAPQVAFSKQENTINLEWGAVEYAKSYEVYVNGVLQRVRENGSGAEKYEILSSASATVSCSFVTLEPGKYSVYVVAKSGSDYIFASQSETNTYTITVISTLSDIEIARNGTKVEVSWEQAKDTIYTVYVENETSGHYYTPAGSSEDWYAQTNKNIVSFDLTMNPTGYYRVSVVAQVQKEYYLPSEKVQKEFFFETLKLEAPIDLTYSETTHILSWSPSSNKTDNSTASQEIRYPSLNDNNGFKVVVYDKNQTEVKTFAKERDVSLTANFSVDLTEFLQEAGPGTYYATVVALGGYLFFEDSDESQQKEFRYDVQIETPTNIAVADTNLSIEHHKLQFKTTQRAEGYTIWVNDEDSGVYLDVTDSDNIKILVNGFLNDAYKATLEGDTISLTGLNYYFDTQKGKLLPQGDYYFSVKAIADKNTEYSDSEVSGNVFYNFIRYLPTPEITLSQQESSNKMLAIWSYNEVYNDFLLVVNGTEISVEASDISGFHAEKKNYEYDISNYVLPNKQNTVQVKALGYQKYNSATESYEGYTTSESEILKNVKYTYYVAQAYAMSNISLQGVVQKNNTVGGEGDTVYFNLAFNSEKYANYFKFDYTYYQNGAIISNSKTYNFWYEGRTDVFNSDVINPDWLAKYTNTYYTVEIGFNDSDDVSKNLDVDADCITAFKSSNNIFTDDVRMPGVEDFKYDSSTSTFSWKFLKSADSFISSFGYYYRYKSNGEFISNAQYGTFDKTKTKEDNDYVYYEVQHLFDYAGTIEIALWPYSSNQNVQSGANKQVLTTSINVKLATPKNLTITQNAETQNIYISWSPVANQSMSSNSYYVSLYRHNSTSDETGVWLASKTIGFSNSTITLNASEIYSNLLYERLIVRAEVYAVGYEIDGGKYIQSDTAYSDFFEYFPIIQTPSISLNESKLTITKLQKEFANLYTVYYYFDSENEEETEKDVKVLGEFNTETGTSSDSKITFQNSNITISTYLSDYFNRENVSNGIYKIFVVASNTSWLQEDGSYVSSEPSSEAMFEVSQTFDSTTIYYINGYTGKQDSSDKIPTLDFGFKKISGKNNLGNGQTEEVSAGGYKFALYNISDASEVLTLSVVATNDGFKFVNKDFDQKLENENGVWTVYEVDEQTKEKKLLATFQDKGSRYVFQYYAVTGMEIGNSYRLEVIVLENSTKHFKESAPVSTGFKPKAQTIKTPRVGFFQTGSSYLKAYVETDETLQKPQIIYIEKTTNSNYDQAGNNARVDVSIKTVYGDNLFEKTFEQVTVSKVSSTLNFYSYSFNPSELFGSYQGIYEITIRFRETSVATPSAFSNPVYVYHSSSLGAVEGVQVTTGEIGSTEPVQVNITVLKTLITTNFKGFDLTVSTKSDATNFVSETTTFNLGITPDSLYYKNYESNELFCVFKYEIPIGYINGFKNSDNPTQVVTWKTFDYNFEFSVKSASFDATLSSDYADAVDVERYPESADAYKEMRDDAMPESFVFKTESEAKSYVIITSNRTLAPSNLKMLDGGTITWDVVANSTYGYVYYAWDVVTNTITLYRYDKTSQQAKEVLLTQKSGKLFFDSAGTEVFYRSGFEDYESYHGDVQNMDFWFTTNQNSFTISNFNQNDSTKIYGAVVWAKASSAGYSATAYNTFYVGGQELPNFDMTIEVLDGVYYLVWDDPFASISTDLLSNVDKTTKYAIFFDQTNKATKTYGVSLGSNITIADGKTRLTLGDLTPDERNCVVTIIIADFNVKDELAKEHTVLKGQTVCRDVNLPLEVSGTVWLKVEISEDLTDYTLTWKATENATIYDFILTNNDIVHSNLSFGDDGIWKYSGSTLSPYDQFSVTVPTFDGSTTTKIQSTLALGTLTVPIEVSLLQSGNDIFYTANITEWVNQLQSLKNIPKNVYKLWGVVASDKTQNIISTHNLSGNGVGTGDYQGFNESKTQIIFYEQAGTVFDFTYTFTDNEKLVDGERKRTKLLTFKALNDDFNRSAFKIEIKDLDGNEIVLYTDSVSNVDVKTIYYAKSGISSSSLALFPLFNGSGENYFIQAENSTTITLDLTTYLEQIPAGDYKFYVTIVPVEANSYVRIGNTVDYEFINNRMLELDSSIKYVDVVVDSYIESADTTPNNEKHTTFGEPIFVTDQSLLEIVENHLKNYIFNIKTVRKMFDETQGQGIESLRVYFYQKGSMIEISNVSISQIQDKVLQAFSTVNETFGTNLKVANFVESDGNVQIEFQNAVGKTDEEMSNINSELAKAIRLQLEGFSVSQATSFDVQVLALNLFDVETQSFDLNPGYYSLKLVAVGDQIYYNDANIFDYTFGKNLENIAIYQRHMIGNTSLEAVEYRTTDYNTLYDLKIQHGISEIGATFEVWCFDENGNFLWKESSVTIEGEQGKVDPTVSVFNFLLKNIELMSYANFSFKTKWISSEADLQNLILNSDLNETKAISYNHHIGTVHADLIQKEDGSYIFETRDTFGYHWYNKEIEDLGGYVDTSDFYVIVLDPTLNTKIHYQITMTNSAGEIKIYNAYVIVTYVANDDGIYSVHYELDTENSDKLFNETIDKKFDAIPMFTLETMDDNGTERTVLKFNDLNYIYNTKEIVDIYNFNSSFVDLIRNGASIKEQAGVQTTTFFESNSNANSYVFSDVYATKNDFDDKQETTFRFWQDSWGSSYKDLYISNVGLNNNPNDENNQYGDFQWNFTNNTRQNCKVTFYVLVNDIPIKKQAEVNTTEMQTFRISLYDVLWADNKIDSNSNEILLYAVVDGWLDLPLYTEIYDLTNNVLLSDPQFLWATTITRGSELGDGATWITADSDNGVAGAVNLSATFNKYYSNDARLWEDDVVNGMPGVKFKLEVLRVNNQVYNNYRNESFDKVKSLLGNEIKQDSYIYREFSQEELDEWIAYQKETDEENGETPTAYNMTFDMFLYGEDGQHQVEGGATKNVSYAFNLNKMLRYYDKDQEVWFYAEELISGGYFLVLSLVSTYNTVNNEVLYKDAVVFSSSKLIVASWIVDDVQVVDHVDDAAYQKSYPSYSDTKMIYESYSQDLRDSLKTAWAENETKRAVYLKFKVKGIEDFDDATVLHYPKSYTIRHSQTGEANEDETLGAKMSKIGTDFTPISQNPLADGYIYIDISSLFWPKENCLPNDTRAEIYRFTYGAHYFRVYGNKVDDIAEDSSHKSADQNNDAMLHYIKFSQIAYKTISFTEEGKIYNLSFVWNCLFYQSVFKNNASKIVNMPQIKIINTLVPSTDDETGGQTQFPIVLSESQRKVYMTESGNDYNYSYRFDLEEDSNLLGIKASVVSKIINSIDFQVLSNGFSEFVLDSNITNFQKVIAKGLDAPILGISTAYSTITANQKAKEEYYYVAQDDNFSIVKNNVYYNLYLSMKTDGFLEGPNPIASGWKYAIVMIQTTATKSNNMHSAIYLKIDWNGGNSFYITVYDSYVRTDYGEGDYSEKFGNQLAQFSNLCSPSDVNYIHTNKTKEYYVQNSKTSTYAQKTTYTTVEFSAIPLKLGWMFDEYTEDNTKSVYYYISDSYFLRGKILTPEFEFEDPSEPDRKLVSSNSVGTVLFRHHVRLAVPYIAEVVFSGNNPYVNGIIKYDEDGSPVLKYVESYGEIVTDTKITLTITNVGKDANSLALYIVKGDIDIMKSKNYTASSRYDSTGNVLVINTLINSNSPFYNGNWLKVDGTDTKTVTLVLDEYSLDEYQDYYNIPNINGKSLYELFITEFVPHKLTFATRAYNTNEIQNYLIHTTYQNNKVVDFKISNIYQGSTENHSFLQQIFLNSVDLKTTTLEEVSRGSTKMDVWGFYSAPIGQDIYVSTDFGQPTNLLAEQYKSGETKMFVGREAYCLSSYLAFSKTEPNSSTGNIGNEQRAQEIIFKKQLSWVENGDGYRDKEFFFMGLLDGETVLDDEGEMEEVKVDGKYITANIYDASDVSDMSRYSTYIVYNPYIYIPDEGVNEYDNVNGSDLGLTFMIEAYYGDSLMFSQNLTNINSNYSNRVDSSSYSSNHDFYSQMYNYFLSKGIDVTNGIKVRYEITVALKEDDSIWTDSQMRSRDLMFYHRTFTSNPTVDEMNPKANQWASEETQDSPGDENTGLLKPDFIPLRFTYDQNKNLKIKPTHYQIKVFTGSGGERAEFEFDLESGGYVNLAEQIEAQYKSGKTDFMFDVNGKDWATGSSWKFSVRPFYDLKISGYNSRIYGKQLWTSNFSLILKLSDLRNIGTTYSFNSTYENNMLNANTISNSSAERKAPSYNNQNGSAISVSEMDGFLGDNANISKNYVSSWEIEVSGVGTKEISGEFNPKNVIIAFNNICQNAPGGVYSVYYKLYGQSITFDSDYSGSWKLIYRKIYTNAEDDFSITQSGSTITLQGLNSTSVSAKQSSGYNASDDAYNAFGTKSTAKNTTNSSLTYKNNLTTSVFLQQKMWGGSQEYNPVQWSGSTKTVANDSESESTESVKYPVSIQRCNSVSYTIDPKSWEALMVSENVAKSCGVSALADHLVNGGIYSEETKGKFQLGKNKVLVKVESTKPEYEVGYYYTFEFDVVYVESFTPSITGSPRVYQEEILTNGKINFGHTSEDDVGTINYNVVEETGKMESIDSGEGTASATGKEANQSIDIKATLYLRYRAYIYDTEYSSSSMYNFTNKGSGSEDKWHAKLTGKYTNAQGEEVDKGVIWEGEPDNGEYVEEGIWDYLPLTVWVFNNKIWLTVGVENSNFVTTISDISLTFYSVFAGTSLCGENYLPEKISPSIPDANVTPPNLQNSTYSQSVRYSGSINVSASSTSGSISVSASVGDADFVHNTSATFNYSGSGSGSIHSYEMVQYYKEITVDDGDGKSHTEKVEDGPPKYEDRGTNEWQLSKSGSFTFGKGPDSQSESFSESCTANGPSTDNPQSTVGEKTITLESASVKIEMASGNFGKPKWAETILEPYSWEKCAECRGTGRVKCGSCDGKGYVDSTRLWKTVKAGCESCGGEGDQWTYFGKGAYKKGTGKVKCGNCSGKGKVHIKLGGETS